MNETLQKFEQKLPRKISLRNKKENRKKICSFTEEADLLTNVITYNDTWIFQYNSETKFQSMH